MSSDSCPSYLSCKGFAVYSQRHDIAIVELSANCASDWNVCSGLGCVDDVVRRDVVDDKRWDGGCRVNTIQVVVCCAARVACGIHSCDRAINGDVWVGYKFSTWNINREYTCRIDGAGVVSSIDRESDGIAIIELAADGTSDWNVCA